MHCNLCENFEEARIRSAAPNQQWTRKLMHTYTPTLHARHSSPHFSEADHRRQSFCRGCRVATKSNKEAERSTGDSSKNCTKASFGAS